MDDYFLCSIIKEKKKKFMLSFSDVLILVKNTAGTCEVQCIFATKQETCSACMFKTYKESKYTGSLLLLIRPYFFEAAGVTRGPFSSTIMKSSR